MLRHTLRFARKYSASPKTSSLNLGLIGGILCLGPAYAFLRSRVQSPTPLETTSDKQDEHHLKSMVTAGMPYVEYVIVGGGTASFSAMEAIKSAKPNANILIVSEQEYLPYERPPLSKELWFSKESDQLTFTDWQGHSKSLFYKPKGKPNMM